VQQGSNTLICLVSTCAIRFILHASDFHILFLEKLQFCFLVFQAKLKNANIQIPRTKMQIRCMVGMVHGELADTFPPPTLHNHSAEFALLTTYRKYG
jgi:hypothetical protein